MEYMNGIHMFDHNELPALPDGLSRESPLKSDFGFKIVSGVNGLEWKAATEDDMRISESARLGISPDEVEIEVEKLGGCDQIGPTQCSTENGFCWGSKCKLMFNPDTQHYYCKCA